jgi:hypothetical protein
MTGPTDPQPARAETNVTRWVTAGLIVLVVIVGVVSVIGDQLKLGGSGPSIDLPEREPPHRVVYWFVATGSANEDLEIRYTGADGEDEELSLPGVVPAWRQEVRTEPGLYGLSFTVSTQSSDLNYTLRCVIEIDGFVEQKMEGRFCTVFVHFPRPSRERPRVTTPPTATTPRTRAPLPAGCRLVTTADVTEIVAHAAGGVIKPVLSVEGNARMCRYWIDAATGYIEFQWTPGRDHRPIPGIPRVPELDVPGYWFDYGGHSGRMLVYARGGELRVDIHFVVLEVQARRAALEVVAMARPRLR